MKQKLMISYSRCQTPFVERLYAELENAEYCVWLDYRSLVPAKHWYQQIEAGVSGADAVLLIVSKDSIQSKNVESEWKLALTLKKRVILLIFEAFPLPAELQGCEWVDFRVNHKKSLKQIMQMLDNSPKVVTSQVPQKGFKAPMRFWLALILSVVVLISSIPAWWTILIPYVIVPLPWQIYKRNYSFSRVIPVLLFLPFIAIYSVTFFGSSAIESDGLPILIVELGCLSVPTGWVLLALLLTPTMQRRAAPAAARVRFANPLVVDVEKPRCVTFTIDYAPEDERYAKDLRSGLEKYGHRLAGSDEKTEAIFVLLSTYKTGTEYDPDSQAVYPILLQATGNIAPNLQHTQWIDFRNGMHNINKLARLLPEPEQLLKALAIAPTGSREVFPLAVNAMQYFFILTGIMGGSGFVMDIIFTAPKLFNGTIDTGALRYFFFAIMNSVLLFGAVLYSMKGLRLRRGGTAAIYPLIVLTVLQIMIYASNFLISLEFFLGGNVPGAIFTVITYPLGVFGLLLFLLFRWKELYRWLPRRQNDSVGKLESALLLYTPLRQRVVVFHILFHAVLLSMLYRYYIFSMIGLALGVFNVFLPRLLLALGFRWLARHVWK